MLARMAKSYKTDNIKCWLRCKVTESHIWLGWVLSIIITLENTLAVSYKVKYTLNTWPSDSTPR